ncbi:MAG TPA: hypothetical protein V6D05_05115 [Stenomitos sp.]
MRWIVLLAALLALGNALRGWFGKVDWKESDRRFGVAFVGVLDLQILLGLLLQFMLSPVTKAAYANMKGAMKDPALRFFAVEHIAVMVVAAALAHVGSVMVKRAAPEAKYRTAAIWYGLAILAIMFGIPWGRPLLPGLG